MKFCLYNQEFSFVLLIFIYLEFSFVLCSFHENPISCMQRIFFSLAPFSFNSPFCLLRLYLSIALLFVFCYCFFVSFFFVTLMFLALLFMFVASCGRWGAGPPSAPDRVSGVFRSELDYREIFLTLFPPPHPPFFFFLCLTVLYFFSFVSLSPNFFFSFFPVCFFSSPPLPFFSVACFLFHRFQLSLFLTFFSKICFMSFSFPIIPQRVVFMFYA